MQHGEEISEKERHMNAIYRSIWNHALHSWVAVPETQAARGKPGRAASRRPGRGAALAGAVLGLSVLTVPLQAQASCAMLSPGVAASNGWDCTLVLSNNSVLTGADSTGLFNAMGLNSNAHAQGGSHITLKNTDPNGAPVGYAAGGGLVRFFGNGFQLYGANGAHATGTDVATGTASRVVFTGTTTIGDAANPITGKGLWADNGGSISMGDMTITAAGGNSTWGLLAESGGQIKSSGLLTIYQNGATNTNVGPVVASGSGSKITLQDVTVRRTNAGASSSVLAGRAGGTISVAGATDIYMEGTNDLTPISAQGTNTRIDLGTTTKIDFVGNNTRGAAIGAEQGNGIITANGPITIRTEGSAGLVAVGSTQIQAKVVNIRVGVDDLNSDGVMSGLGNSFGHGVYASELGQC